MRLKLDIEPVMCIHLYRGVDFNRQRKPRCGTSRASGTSTGAARRCFSTGRTTPSSWSAPDPAGWSFSMAPCCTPAVPPAASVSRRDFRLPSRSRRRPPETQDDEPARPGSSAGRRLCRTMDPYESPSTQRLTIGMRILRNATRTDSASGARKRHSTSCEWAELSTRINRTRCSSMHSRAPSPSGRLSAASAAGGAHSTYTSVSRSPDRGLIPPHR